MRQGQRARRGLAIAVALAIGVSTAAAGCSSSDDDFLYIYSGRTKNLIRPLLDQFAEESGVKIDVRYGDSADLALLLDEEGDRTNVDVFVSQSPGAVGYLDAQGLLGELPESVTGMVPEGDAAEDGSWVGLSGRVRTLVYNTDLIDPADLPDSVLDLADPQYAGQVGVAPTNGSFQDFVTVLRSHVGEEETGDFLTALADGGAPTFSNNTAIVEAVGRGEVPMGLVNHYYAFVAKAEDPDLPVENYFFPAGDYGSTLLVTAASIVEGSDMPDEAEQFVEFLLSSEAQQYFGDETFEYPLASGAEPADELPPFDEITTTRVDLGELGSGLEATAELIDASGLHS
ncbi:MAG TPA: extracellular solute-binding protein [Acidimicrobiales bacterium]|nr:extracellular solute-binding protein [Acidimicrobiales bacterium]